ISKYGVIAFMSSDPTGSKSKVYLYKYAAGTPIPPSNTFTTKCSQSGVIHCFPFDNFSEIQKATWDQSDSALNTEMLRRGFIWGSMAWISRSANEAVSVAKDNPGGFSIPAIDSSVFADGGGSLRFDTPSLSGPAGAEYLNDFSGNLGQTPRIYI